MPVKAAQDEVIDGVTCYRVDALSQDLKESVCPAPFPPVSHPPVRLIIVT